MKDKRLLQITYKHKGERYTDILAADEVCLTRRWLDSVAGK